jgi:hypothetical protein
MHSDLSQILHNLLVFARCDYSCRYYLDQQFSCVFGNSDSVINHWTTPPLYPPYMPLAALHAARCLGLSRFWQPVLQ